MTGTALNNGTLLVDEDLRAEATQFVEDAHDRVVVGVSLTFDDGSTVVLPSDLSGFVSHTLHGLSHGAVSVAATPPELTSTNAADLLGVSRPTLMKMVKDGVLQARRVGSHSRFDTIEVIALSKSRRADREAAFADLRAWEEDNEGSVVSAK